MFKKVAFTMYPISDVARARKFYEETLGPQRDCLALTNFIPDKPGDAAGGTIALEVEDLDEGNSILLHQLKPKAK